MDTSTKFRLLSRVCVAFLCSSLRCTSDFLLFLDDTLTPLSYKDNLSLVEHVFGSPPFLELQETSN